MPSTGQVVGDYRLIHPLGGGGFGTVWMAEHVRLGNPVAIKFATNDVDADLVARFLREAKLVAAIKHRHVVEVIDFGTEGDEAFMIMELVTGVTLSDLLTRDEYPEAGVAVQIVQQLLKAVAACHEAGVDHRDLKPENVFVESDDDGHVFVKLVDFGISKVVDPAKRARGHESVVPTHEGWIVGTPEYMSLEQARGDAATDHRADVYSVGVMLYELLSGGMPFDTENPSVVLAKVLLGSPKPFIERRPDLPALAEVVSRAMAKEPGDRFQDAKAMRDALVEAAARDLSDVRDAERAVERRGSAALDETGAERAVEDEYLLALEGLGAGGSPGRSAARWAVGLVAVLALGAGLWAWSTRSAPRPSASTLPPEAPAGAEPLDPVEGEVADAEDAPADLEPLAPPEAPAVPVLDESAETLEPPADTLEEPAAAMHSARRRSSRMNRAQMANEPTDTADVADPVGSGTPPMDETSMTGIVRELDF